MTSFVFLCSPLQSHHPQRPGAESSECWDTIQSHSQRINYECGGLLWSAGISHFTLNWSHRQRDICCLIDVHVCVGSTNMLHILYVLNMESSKSELTVKRTLHIHPVLSWFSSFSFKKPRRLLWCAPESHSSGLTHPIVCSVLIKLMLLGKKTHHIRRGSSITELSEQPIREQDPADHISINANTASPLGVVNMLMRGWGM